MTYVQTRYYGEKEGRREGLGDKHVIAWLYYFGTIKAI